jgi:hypothetical protein
VVFATGSLHFRAVHGVVELFPELRRFAEKSAMKLLKRFKFCGQIWYPNGKETLSYERTGVGAKNVN